MLLLLEPSTARVPKIRDAQMGAALSTPQPAPLPAAGRPPGKQRQQEEGLVPIGDDERTVARGRRCGTSSSARHPSVPFASVRGCGAVYPSTSRAACVGHDQRPLSPQRQRIQAMDTQSIEAAQTVREEELRRRAKARKAAQRASAEQKKRAVVQRGGLYMTVDEADLLRRQGRQAGGWQGSAAPADPASPPSPPQTIMRCFDFASKEVDDWASQAEDEFGHRLIGRTGLPYRPRRERAAPTSLKAVLEQADVENLIRLLDEFGSRGSAASGLAADCLAQVRTWCFAGRQVEMVRAGICPSLISTMRAHRTIAHVAAVGSECIGLLAGEQEGLESTLVDSGALNICLHVCVTHAAAEDVLGAAFQAIANLCFAAHPHDKAGCARKTAAVRQGAFAAISTGMGKLPSSQWVQEAGVLVVGGLCNGADHEAHMRRTQARAVGALRHAFQATERFPPEESMPTHRRAYEAAWLLVRHLHEETFL